MGLNPMQIYLSIIYLSACLPARHASLPARQPASLTATLPA